MQVAPVGGVLQVVRLGAQWYEVLGMGAGCGAVDWFYRRWRQADRARRKTKQPLTDTNSHNNSGKWRCFLQCLCAIVLSLAEAVRGTMSEAPDMSVEGRLCMCVVIIACVVCRSGTCYHDDSITHPTNSGGKNNNIAALCQNALSVLLSCCALVSLLFAAQSGRTSSSVAWVLAAVDYMVADAPVWWMGASIGAASIASAFQPPPALQPPWPFAGLVLPCMLVWQRQRFSTQRAALLTMKPETQLYFLACIGGLALCCAVNDAFQLAVLGLHCALRWVPALWRLLCCGRKP